MVIWKYPLTIPLGQLINVPLPVGHLILDIQLQQDVPVMWVLHDIQMDKNMAELPSQRTATWFVGVPTGFDFDKLDLHPNSLHHLKTLDWKGFVLHIFKVYPEHI